MASFPTPGQDDLYTVAIGDAVRAPKAEDWVFGSGVGPETLTPDVSGDLQVFRYVWTGGGDPTVELDPPPATPSADGREIKLILNVGAFGLGSFTWGDGIRANPVSLEPDIVTTIRLRWDGVVNEWIETARGEPGLVAAGSVPDASTTVKGKVELATDAETATGTDATRAVTPAGLASLGLGGVPDASTTVKGKVELATSAETATGTDATRAVTPAGLASLALASQAYADALLDANNAYQYKGGIDCSANPNYPAASAGHTYKVTVAGKLGGAAGVVVEVGDSATCLVDGSAAGNQATVGANWLIVQTNIDGAVVGPAVSVAGDFATFSGTTGKVVQDSGLALDIDGTLAANSDAKVPSQKAVKTYSDVTKVAKSLFDANTMLMATTDDTPVALAIAASRIVGRKAAGDIGALTATEVKAILALDATDLPFTARRLDSAHPALGTGTATTVGNVNVNTGAEVTLATLTIPAAQLAALDLLDYMFGCDAFQQSGGAIVYTFKVKLNGTTIFTTAPSFPNAAAVRYRVDGRFRIDLASLSDQRWQGLIEASAGVGTANMGALLAVANQGLGTVATAADLTSDATIALTCQMASANAAADVRLLTASLTRTR